MTENRMKEIMALMQTVEKLPEKNVLTGREVSQLQTRKGKIFVEIFDNFLESSCARFFCSEGSEMDWHTHKVTQIMIVICGEVHFFTNGQEIVVKPGEVIRWLPGQRHFAVMPVYTEMYDIKIPSE
jgi:quercetin dioxygenase-like cupin family protein